MVAQEPGTSGDARVFYCSSVGLVPIAPGKRSISFSPLDQHASAPGLLFIITLRMQTSQTSSPMVWGYTVGKKVCKNPQDWVELQMLFLRSL